MPWNVPAQVRASVITRRTLAHDLSGDSFHPARHFGRSPS